MFLFVKIFFYRPWILISWNFSNFTIKTLNHYSLNQIRWYQLYFPNFGPVGQNKLFRSEIKSYPSPKFQFLNVFNSNKIRVTQDLSINSSGFIEFALVKPWSSILEHGTRQWLTYLINYRNACQVSKPLQSRCNEMLCTYVMQLLYCSLQHIKASKQITHCLSNFEMWQYQWNYY